MSGQVWYPPNIAAICPEQRAPLTQCSSTGYLYLALLTQLYSNATMSIKPEKAEDWQFPGDVNFGHFSPVQDDFEDYHAPRRSPFEIESEPILHDDFLPRIGTKVRSNGPGASVGYSESFSEFPEYVNPFLKDRSAGFDFNYRKRSISDVEAAESKIVSVDKEKKKSGGKRRKKRQAIETYDFIVVGAGSAGCVIANRLSEVKKWKVLLIEAGPEEPDVTRVPALAPVLAQSNIDWMYRTQPEKLTCRAQRGQTCAWLSGRVMGGSSATNFMVYMRGNKRDYDEWAELGNVGWSYREVLPYFKKSESNQNIEAKDQYHHGTEGPQNVERFSNVDQNAIMLVESFREKGFPLVDFNGHQQIGTMITQTTSKDGKRASTNVSFIKPIRYKRSNLILRTNAQVIRILIDKHMKAYGIMYVQYGSSYEVHTTKEIIISAGALNSPKILMLSGIGPKDDLNKLKIPVIKNLKVGHNLQDHVTTEAVLMELTNKTSTLTSGNQMLKRLEEYYKSGTKYDPLSATGVLQITAFYRTQLATTDKSVPDIQFHFDGRNSKEFYSDPTTYLATAIFPFSDYNSINVRPILLHPESRGILTLNKTDPTFGPPLIYPRFFTVKKDLDTLVAALKFATKLENTKAFRDNGVKFIRKPVNACSRYKWGTYAYFACVITRYTGTIYHHSGTCKMGPSHDEGAVVDSRLKVYGIHNLRVADASIMPHVVRGNTNAPCMMIGEKVSDMIKEDWNHNIVNENSTIISNINVEIYH